MEVAREGARKPCGRGKFRGPIAVCWFSSDSQVIPGRGFPLEISVGRCFILQGEEQNKAVIGEYNSKKAHHMPGSLSIFCGDTISQPGTIFCFFSGAQRRPKSSKIAVATRAQFEDMILLNDLGWVAGQSSRATNLDEPVKSPKRNPAKLLTNPCVCNSFPWKSMLLSATCHH